MTLNLFSDMELFVFCEKTAFNYFKNYLNSDLVSDLNAYEKENNISIGSYALYDEVDNA